MAKILSTSTLKVRDGNKFVEVAAIQGLDGKVKDVVDATTGESFVGDDGVARVTSGGGGGGTSDHAQLTNRNADNQHPMSAITGLSEAIGGIQQELNDKMEFFKVVYDSTGDCFKDVNGNIMDFAALEEKYRDDKYFLYCEYMMVTYIPCLPPDLDPAYDKKMLEFVSTWIYGGVINVSRLAINEDEEIRNETKIAEESSNKVNSITNTTSTTEYPSNKAVVDYVAGHGGGGGGISDVKVNNTSVVSSGVANIPVATNSAYGVVKTLANSGLKSVTTGGLAGSIAIDGATTTNIDNRNTTSWSKDYIPITISKLDYAVESALKAPTTIYPAYSEETQAAIKERLGISRDIFVAVYNETTWADIDAAYQAGKICLCVRENSSGNPVLYTLSNASNYTAGSDRYWYFASATTDPTVRSVYVREKYDNKTEVGKNTNWGSATADLLKQVWKASYAGQALVVGNDGVVEPAFEVARATYAGTANGITVGTDRYMLNTHTLTWSDGNGTTHSVTLMGGELS